MTNDEMRDHIFELIGSNFFNQWKERHQVHYTFVKGNLKLQMPPPYSLVIQESEKGSWHVPLALHTGDETSRTWLCITRQSSQDAEANVCNSVDTPNFNHHNTKDAEGPQEFSNGVGIMDSQVDENNTTSLTGKRKERSPPL